MALTLDSNLLSALEDYKLRKSRASNRMAPIQSYCVDRLAELGVPDALPERAVRVAYKTKAWDVVKASGHRPELAITCRSIISNHGGTVPNRVDDLLGEGVALHRAFPRAVAGYLMVMSKRDESAKAPKKTDDWFARLVASVTRAGGRGSEHDIPERFEAVACLEVDFDTRPFVLTRCFVFPAEKDNSDYREFFTILAHKHRERFS